MGMAISTKDGNCSIRETFETDDQPGGIKRYPIFRQSHGRFTCFYRPPATEIARNQWNRVVLRFFWWFQCLDTWKYLVGGEIWQWHSGQFGPEELELEIWERWPWAKGTRSWCIQPKLWRHPGTSSLRRKSLTDWQVFGGFSGWVLAPSFHQFSFFGIAPSFGFWALKSTWLVGFPFTQRSDRSQSDQMHRAVAIYHPKSWTQLDLTNSNAIPPVMSSSAIWGPV